MVVMKVNESKWQEMFAYFGSDNVHHEELPFATYRYISVRVVQVNILGVRSFTVVINFL